MDEVHTYWGIVLCWGLKSWKNNLKSTLCRLGWEATIYHIWKQRNNIRHDGQVYTEEKIVSQIRWEDRTKLISTGSLKGHRKMKPFVIVGEYIKRYCVDLCFFWLPVVI